MSKFIEKVKRRLRGEFVSRTRKCSFYQFLYPVMWKIRLGCVAGDGPYLAARPNPGAGIGHQIANWNAGYWFAQQFGLRFAHIPFSSPEWETFLGFGEGEVTVEELCKQGYKIRRLPLFDEYDLKEVEQIRRCIAAYAGRKVILLCEQDQFYQDQFGVMEDIQRKFYAAPARANDRLIYRSDVLNIAVHVRRGDIVQGAHKGDAGMMKRWQDTEYFEKVTESVVHAAGDRSVELHIFSQGKREDFAGFEKFKGIQFHLDMGARESFLHMVMANVLITSKSSFSYKPALLSKGVKVCPRKFWHGYPKTKDWILVDNDGKLENAGVFRYPGVS